MKDKIIGIVEHIIRDPETGDEQAVIKLFPPHSLLYGYVEVKKI